MNNMIYGDYSQKELYGLYTGKKNAGQKPAASASFLALALQAGSAGAGCQTAGVVTLSSGKNGTSAINAASTMSSAEALSSLDAYRSQMVSCASQLRTEAPQETQPATLEEMLREKYPGIKYHVFDAGTNYWKSRNDYPHYLLYQEKIDTNALENWEPSGPNPAYSSSKELRALGAVPPGSKAVVIHPRVQERMEQDPEYAQEILTRIDTWFTFDVLRNEAILPGCTAGMSQAVAIGEDGSIVNAVSSGQPRLTKSSSSTTDWWDIRKARHAYYMSLITEKQLQNRLIMAETDSGDLTDGLAAFSSSQAARAELADMMEGSRLLDIFGPTLGGVSTEYVLDLTKELVWGSSGI